MENIKVLFVCLGNICRSPAAEVIAKKIIASRSLNSLIVCDSAGLSAIHSGEKADKRMQKTLAARGYNCDVRSRAVCDDDFDRFDYILAMDQANYDALCRFTNRSSHAKVLKICQFTVSRSEENVPDPYYGGNEGFARVIDILEDAVGGFVDHLEQNHSLLKSS